MKRLQPIATTELLERGLATELLREDQPFLSETPLLSYSGSSELKAKACHPEPDFLLRITDATIGFYGIVCKNGYFLDVNNGYSNSDLAGMRAAFGLSRTILGNFRWREARGRITLQRACYMSAMENYAAWVMGEVPRLKYYDSYISPECPLILHGTIRDYHRAILRLFGVSDSHIVNVPAETDVSIEDLIFASPTYRRHIPSPGGVAFLKQSSNSFSLNHQWKGSKIYLTRDGQKMRRMLNEQQIHGALEKEGYQIIRPESVSVLDQISMFSLAKTIVTPFGATLANMAFCNQRPHVCVIRTKFTNEFARLSVMAGARFSVFDQVLRFKAPLFSKDRELHQTFRVDPELLLAFLKRFEEKSD